MLGATLTGFGLRLFFNDDDLAAPDADGCRE
jgi:hypothetical protein